MTIRRKLKEFAASANRPINNSPQTTTVTNILYMKILYTIDNYILQPDYSYGDDSGFYPLSNYSLDNFLNDIRDDSVDTSKRIQPIPLPAVPVVQYPCYVIMSIDLDGVAQIDATNRIMTNDPYTGSPYTTFDYFNLVLAPDDPNVPSPPYHIAYFKAISPSQNYENNAAIDGFNLYLQFPTPDGLGSGYIDPDIKDTGIGITPIVEGGGSGK